MIKTINGGKSGKYGKDFMKIKSNSDEDLPLNKPLKLHAMTIIIRSVFEENEKYYPQTFFRRMLAWVIKMLQCERLIFQKELILIKQVHQKMYAFSVLVF